jgi:hypothetical protein
MMVRRTRTLAISLCVAAIAACDSPTDPATPEIKGGLDPAAHEVATTTCVTGATTLVVSVYPKTIAVGEHATPYASVYSATGAGLSSRAVTWTIQDTAIVHVTGIDSNGRPILTGRRGGTTNIVGHCGSSITTSKPLAVTSASGDIMTVSFPTQSLSVGQTTQAVAKETTSSGSAVTLGTVTWTSSNTAIATVSSTGLVTGKATGSATITAKTATATGSASITIGSSSSVASPSVSGISAAEPATPQITPAYGALPTASRVVRVAAGGNLQAALDNALPGDAILLAPGAKFTGNFILRNKNIASPCSAWITVRTDATAPTLGQRTTPSIAAGYAKLVSTTVAPALKTDPKASCYRVSGLEIVLPVISSYNYGLIFLGDGGNLSAGETQVTMDIAPRNLVLDHLYVHGESGSNFTRCIALNSASTVIADSWISECHAKGFDSQAIGGWNGPGPYLIQNNYLAAAGENIMFGGADPHITNLVPSDITIRGNHFYKNPAWKGVWTIKNLLELKNSRRLLIENNVFENNWIAAQTGMAIIFKSANDGGTAPWQGTTDVTFRYNIVRNSPQGLAIAAHPETNPAVHVARVRVENNLFYNIGTYNGTSYGRMLILLQDPHDLTIVHNTMIHNYTGDGQMMISDVSYGAARNIVLSNNVATKGGPYGAVMYSGARIGTESLNAFASSYWAFDRNVVIGLDPEFVPWHPQTSYYASTMAAVGFTNASGGDYSLGSASPYRGKATDSKDPGADFPGLRQRTGSTIVP